MKEQFYLARCGVEFGYPTPVFEGLRRNTQQVFYQGMIERQLALLEPDARRELLRGSQDGNLTQAEVLFANDFELELRGREKILRKPQFLLFLVLDVRGCSGLSGALRDLLVYKVVRAAGARLRDDWGLDVQSYTGFDLGPLGLRREQVSPDLFLPE